jgi:hypothetical protein
LALLLASGIIKPGRWQKTLADVARSSPVHGMVVQVALQAALRGQPDKLPRDTAKLIDLLLELSAELNQSIVDAACRNLLQRCTAGKVRQTAKTLLELSGSDFTNSAGSILRQAIQQRVTAHASR